jgi:hypothetical protein
VVVLSDSTLMYIGEMCWIGPVSACLSAESGRVELIRGPAIVAPVGGDLHAGGGGITSPSCVLVSERLWCWFTRGCVGGLCRPRLGVLCRRGVFCMCVTLSELCRRATQFCGPNILSINITLEVSCRTRVLPSKYSWHMQFEYRSWVWQRPFVGWIRSSLLLSAR